MTLDSALAVAAMQCPRNDDDDDRYILTPKLMWQMGRALLYIAEATRRVKLEPEDSTPVSVRRVGFIPGTTELAFGDFAPYLGSVEGLHLRDPMIGNSAERLAPSFTISTQTDDVPVPYDSVDELLGRFAAQSMETQALPVTTDIADYGGDSPRSMLPSSPLTPDSAAPADDVEDLTEFVRYPVEHHDRDDSNRTFDTDSFLGRSPVDSFYLDSRRTSETQEADVVMTTPRTTPPQGWHTAPTSPIPPQGGLAPPTATDTATMSPSTDQVVQPQPLA